MIERDRAWPADRVSPAEGFLLRAAAASDGAAAIEAWRSFRTLVKEGDETMGQRRLLPLAFRNLLRHGGPKDPYLTHAYANSFGANARLLGEAGSALRALHEASIETMVLKGTALLVGHYRDLGARPMSDADILVPEPRIREALDALDASGWRSDPARRWLGSPQHADPVFSPNGANVDLHRHATTEAPWAVADRRFFDDATPIEVGGVQTLAMSAGDQLLHSAVHGLRWSIARSPVWMVDIVTLLREGQVDIDKTVRRALELRLHFALRRALETVRDVIEATGEIESLLARLRPVPAGLSERTEQWFRVREPAGLLGALPNLWFSYRRSRSDGRLPIMGFARYLNAAWGRESESGLGAVLATKVWRRLRARRRC